jgi:hypothetical protein
VYGQIGDTQYEVIKYHTSGLLHIASKGLYNWKTCCSEYIKLDKVRVVQYGVPTCRGCKRIYHDRQERARVARTER